METVRVGSGQPEANPFSRCARVIAAKRSQLNQDSREGVVSNVNVSEISQEEVPVPWAPAWAAAAFYI